MNFILFHFSSGVCVNSVIIIFVDRSNSDKERKEGRKRNESRLDFELGQFLRFGILYSICGRRSNPLNFFYPREIYSNKRDRISLPSPTLASLTLPRWKVITRRDPAFCYRSSTPLLEFLDNPVYRSGHSHSKTILRVDLRLPYVYVRYESWVGRVGGRRGKKRGRRGGRERVDRLLFRKSKLIHPSTSPNFSLFSPSCFSGIRCCWSSLVGRGIENRRRDRTSSTTRREVDSPISPLSPPCVAIILEQFSARVWKVL